MFCLTEIMHTLQLPPSLYDLPLHDAIKGELESVFVDKVIAKLGLCISIYDIKTIDGGFVFAGHGASTYTVKFRMIMFRPFIGEVISAKLKEADANGIRLSVGFFDDIYVFPHKMREGLIWEDKPENWGYLSWVWTYETPNEDGTTNELMLSIDGTEEIRFKVESIRYPAIPIDMSNDSIEEEGNDSKTPEKGKNEPLKPFAPMVITGSIDVDGLGPVSWW